MKVDFRGWLSEMFDHFRDTPGRAPLYVLFTLYLTAWYAITSRRPFGHNVYQDDWDLLVVLDACRTDALRAVADEYSFINDVDTVWSTGSQSAEWLAATFTRDRLEEIRETVYVSANGYSEAVLGRGHYPPANNSVPVDLAAWSVVDESDFEAHHNVWETNHDDRYGCVYPSVVTDRTIRAAREQSPDRIIAHYIQPHLPYVGTAYSEDREATEVEQRGYELLETGDASRTEVVEAYEQTLRWVLDDVEELLENVDADRVVITADHGEAFGEWGAYGHPEGFPHPVVRKVPWVETTASDEHTRDPDIDIDNHVTVDVEEHLQDLGYR